MGFIGRLFGSPKAIGDTIESVSKGFDKLIYTKEEKAEDAAKAITEARMMTVKWMESTQGQNLARRLIALMITVGWLLLFFARIGLAIAGVWVDGDELERSAEIISDSIDQMTGAVMLILGFYFAAPHLGSIVQGAMGKLGGKKG